MGGLVSFAQPSIEQNNKNSIEQNEKTKIENDKNTENKMQQKNDIKKETENDKNENDKNENDKNEKENEKEDIRLKYVHFDEWVVELEKYLPKLGSLCHKIVIWMTHCKLNVNDPKKLAEQARDLLEEIKTLESYSLIGISNMTYEDHQAATKNLAEHLYNKYVLKQGLKKEDEPKCQLIVDACQNLYIFSKFAPETYNSISKFNNKLLFQKLQFENNQLNVPLTSIKLNLEENENRQNEKQDEKQEKQNNGKQDEKQEKQNIKQNNEKQEKQNIKQNEKQNDRNENQERVVILFEIEKMVQNKKLGLGIFNTCVYESNKKFAKIKSVSIRDYSKLSENKEAKSVVISFMNPMGNKETYHYIDHLISWLDTVDDIQVLNLKPCKNYNVLQESQMQRIEQVDQHLKKITDLGAQVKLVNYGSDIHFNYDEIQICVDMEHSWIYRNLVLQNLLGTNLF